MRKFCTLIAVALAAAMLATGCGDSSSSTEFASVVEKIPEGESASPAAAAAEEASSAEDAAVEEEDDEEPPAEGMVRSELTNEWIDGDLADQRPLAVMYPINKEAQPQYGINKICVFYEILEEGSMSRQMGILQDWKDLGRIGNLRSIRDYFVYAALEYDPIIIHFGGPELYVKDILTRSDVDNLNGVGGVMGGDYGAFYRIPAGSTSEHTAFSDGEHVLSGANSAGFSLTHRSEYYCAEDHFNFASTKNPNTLEDYSDAVSATSIDMSGSFPVTKSALTYNSGDGLYYKTLYGNAQCDGNTGEQLAFANVIIQRAYCEVRDDHGYLAFQMHDTTRDGYFITRGKMIHVTWSKTSDYGPTRYYDDNGNEIKVNTGRTMIFVIRDGEDSFVVDGTTYSN